MAPNAELQRQVRALQQSYDAGDVQESGKLLTKLKILLARSGLLFPSNNSSSSSSSTPSSSSSSSSQQPLDKDDLLLARTALEIGAFHSLKVKDVPAFTRYEALVAGYYRDLRSILPPSSSRPPLLGLTLLSLLSSSKIAEFHTLLETLDEEIVGDSYVKWPIDLERWLMEGSYTKVWRARERVPREEYAVLLDGLVGKIRNDIASCHELAYSSLALGEATRLLFFTNENETIEFGKNVRHWQFSPTTKTFTFSTSTAPGATSGGDDPMSGDAAARPSTQTHQDRIAKDQIIKTALEYAVELETIV